ncbi:SMI1/KNR4 family protein [Phaeobacter piscinae]|uniref:SMI1/KNR4 family protein n=1 Tax=Phaeobacter piscinae TaxID=1580596 RepID=UPI00058EEE77|nr:SMI1/KNR4 family protein [Phaeobacter piscinae]UTS81913.1 hypothetical protein OL67_003009 [Phaeobacter piscinae]
MSNLKKLHETWSHPDYPPTSINKGDLKALEDNLGVALPSSYRSQLLKIGLPSPTAKLWEWLSENDERHFRWLNRLPFLVLILPEPVPHLADFHHPSDVQKALEWREAGMPEDLLPFAYDSSGSQICFDMEALRGGSRRESPVIFWDCYSLHKTKLSKSFDAFLKLYLP